MERVLVCVIGQIRADRVTWRRFRRRVLEELGADLALAVMTGDPDDADDRFSRHAKYRWSHPQSDDVGTSFDHAQRVLCEERGIAPADWRRMLEVRGIWQGGIRAPNPEPSHTANLFFCRWLLLHGLRHDGVLEQYDRFVITRSDLVWCSPHPPLSILDPGSLWVPDGEHYGGVNDRHLVVSRAHVTEALNLLEEILLRPAELAEEMRGYDGWNIERFLAFHLHRRGILQDVAVFPYVMYTARGLHDSTVTWSPGRFDPRVGHFVKYEAEFRSARAYADVLRTRADWERGDWRTFDWEAVAARPRSWSQRALVWPAQRLVATVRRPGRRTRIAGFVLRFVPGRFISGRIHRRGAEQPPDERAA